jgi:hypothetical protein
VNNTAKTANNTTKFVSFRTKTMNIDPMFDGIAIKFGNNTPMFLNIEATLMNFASLLGSGAAMFTQIAAVFGNFSSPLGNGVLAPGGGAIGCADIVRKTRRAGCRRDDRTSADCITPGVLPDVHVPSPVAASRLRCVENIMHFSYLRHPYGEITKPSSGDC